MLKARIGASLEKSGSATSRRTRAPLRDTGSQDLQNSDTLGVRATVMFCDIRSFTPLAESQTPGDDRLLSTYYTLMFDAISGQGGVVSQIAGDGLMAIFGAPLPLTDHCGAVHCARNDRIDGDVQRRARGSRETANPDRHRHCDRRNGGLHGDQLGATYTIGDTVNIAARLEEHQGSRAPDLIDRRRAGLHESVRSMPSAGADSRQGAIG
jgi:class 3 adenylate cyclase